MLMFDRLDRQKPPVSSWRFNQMVQSLSIGVNVRSRSGAVIDLVALDTFRNNARPASDVRSRARRYRTCKRSRYSGSFAKLSSATGLPPIRCSWMMRSMFSGVAFRYQVPSG